MALKFAPFSSFVDPGFWSEMGARKLSDWQLDESPVPLIGYFVNTDMPGVPCRLSLDFNAFCDIDTLNNERPLWVEARSILCGGQLILTNTLQSFNNIDRKAILEQFTKSDIKKYHFYHWTCFPSLVYPDTIELCQPASNLTNYCQCTIDMSQQINDLFVKYMIDQEYPIAFFVKITNNHVAPVEFVSFEKLSDRSFDLNEYALAFTDPSTYPEHPGWPLRNLLAVLYSYRDSRTVTTIGLRLRPSGGGKIDVVHNSVVWKLQYKHSASMESIKSVGWEKNSHGKLAPRFLDMSATMDPVKLAENAVDLNLELMRWRLVPDLRLEKMKNLKCLLFGAGTLGCNVARGLLAWGVRNITLIDNAHVSASNPVRQSLFKFTDSISGQRISKAQAAANALKDIFPGVHSNGYQLTVPMPGHTVHQNEATSVRWVIEELLTLVREHDCVFLLMDTREGRWLPTLLAAVFGKICISAALGFDGYVIMRHGVRSTDLNDIQPEQTLNVPSSCCILPGYQLGCYFCSDVTAPGNSTTDRTIDQQCTVTRPGVSQIASGIAVELLASIVQHPVRANAPAMVSSINTTTTTDMDDNTTGCLGNVPHQIRGSSFGYVSQFNQMCLAVRRFDRCTACSDYVIQRFESDGIDFVLNVCTDAGLLEKTTGLDVLQQTAGDVQLWEFDDSESVASME